LRKLKGLAEEATETAQRIKAQTLWRESRREQAHEAAAPSPGIGATTQSTFPNFSSNKKGFAIFLSLCLFASNLC